MKKLLIAAVLLVLAVSIAWARTDYRCMNDCLERGYSYKYCKKACSY